MNVMAFNKRDPLLQSRNHILRVNTLLTVHVGLVTVYLIELTSES